MSDMYDDDEFMDISPQHERRGNKMADKEFPNGLLIKAPNEKAPEFVKCHISIKRADLGNWLREKKDDWINLDVNVAKSGKWYCVVNTWMPSAKSADKPAVEPLDDKIPF